MSKASEFFKTKTGKIVGSLAWDYVKRQSADARKAAPIVEAVIEIHEAVKAGGSEDVLKDTAYAVAQTGILNKSNPATVPVSGDAMNPLDFAAGMIRAPWLRRLTDRTFLSMVSAVFAAIGTCYAAWQTQGIPIEEKVKLTYAVILGVTGLIGWWNGSEKAKDTAIGKAAIEAMKPATPQTVSAGGDVTVQSTPASEPVGDSEDISDELVDVANAG